MTLPIPTMPTSRLKVMENRLVRACERLELKEDVYIVFEVPSSSPLAEIQGSDDVASQLIKIHPEADRFLGNYAIWHELKHAQRIQQLGHTEFRRQYEEEAKRLGLESTEPINLGPGEDEIYNKISFEREANALASEMCDILEILIEA